MSSAILKIQNPEDPDSVYLLESLLERAVGARGGGAAFAWATNEGIKLLLRDPVFERFLQKRSFDLIVGVDSVTTRGALQALGEARDTLPGLTVRAFLDDDSTAARQMFHLKVVWFKERDGGTLIVGSGNLTNGGLRNNWEAYSLTHLDERAFKTLSDQWIEWTTALASRLRDVLDTDVVKRAERNEAWTKGVRKIARRVEKPKVPAPPGQVVLVAEIPRSGGVRGRWKQANFDKDNYEEFFGAKVGTQRRMLFQHVDVKANLGPIESRPSVEVKSHNWRFELDAASGLDYPATGRPIGVFLRVRERTFLYRLVLPGPQYAELKRFLDTHWTGSAASIRRVRLDASQAGSLRSVQSLVKAAPEGFADEVPEGLG